MCRSAGVGYDSAAFRRAEAGAVAAVRRFIVERPETRDAERLPFYLESLLVGLGLADAAERERAARGVAAEHARVNLWSKRADGSLETLRALLDRGYRVAVVSNADGRVRGLLETAGLAPLLEFVVDSAEIGVEKPDPRIFHAATGRLGLPPAACAYVGDIYEIDVLGAQAAGLTAVLIGDAPAPDHVVRVPDLPGLHALFRGFA